GDLLGDAPDHLVDIGALAQRAVDLEPELALRRVADLGRRGDGADRRGLVEILAEGPGPALVFAGLLQVAPRHVQADRVAPDVLVGPGRGDPGAAGAHHRDHLGFPVVVAGHRRIVHRAGLARVQRHEV